MSQMKMRISMRKCSHMNVSYINTFIYIVEAVERASCCLFVLGLVAAT